MWPERLLSRRQMTSSGSVPLTSTSMHARLRTGNTPEGPQPILITTCCRSKAFAAMSQITNIAMISVLTQGADRGFSTPAAGGMPLTGRRRLRVLGYHWQAPAACLASAECSEHAAD